MRSSDRLSKLFVGEIGDNRKSDISRLFSKYGEISTIYVDDYKHFAFVEFTSASDAQRALKHTHNKSINGARLRVEYAKPDKPTRDSRRPLSREHSPNLALYNHLQVTANRLPSMQSVRHNFHQYHPSSMMANSSTSRGRSLTPPSLKQNARTSSMNHVRTHDFYPPYYPPHLAMFSDPAYYRAYGDPYSMQRLPPGAFLPPSSSPPSSSSRAYRNMHSSSNSDRYPPVSSRKRTRRSRSPNRRRDSTSRRNRSSRERKRQRRTPSPSSPPQRRERGPQTPPPTSSSSSSHRSKKRMHSESETFPSTSEQKSSTPSPSDDERAPAEDQQSNSRRSEDHDSDHQNSKRRTNE